MKRTRLSVGLSSAFLLAGCVASNASPQPSATRPPVTYAPNAYKDAGTTAPTELAGRTAQSLTTMLGKPRLDVREGIGRKLQFMNERCVLDTYLYSRRLGEEATVAYAEARDLQGNDVAVTQCITSMRRQ